MPVGLRPPGGPGGQNPKKKTKSPKISAGNGVRHGNALTIFMNIVRAIACLTPFPADFFGLLFFCFSDFDPRGLLEAEGRPANMMINMIIKMAINQS